MTDEVVGARRRWWTLIVLCLGAVMIDIDGTVVNVALPSIRGDLSLSDASVVWVMDAYLATFGGFLLLGGRLGDLFGQRRVLLAGLAVFTGASLDCGLASSQSLLIFGRAVQGAGGAIVAALTLSLIVELFEDASERAKAMGTYAFICTGGGSLGLLVGGALTRTLGWHWIFLVNLPIGAGVFFFGKILLRSGPQPRGEKRLDIAGALMVTTGLVLAIYAITHGNQKGWLSGRTLGVLCAAGALLVSFVWHQRRLGTPLLPLQLFRVRNLSVANIASLPFAASVYGWAFTGALYLQVVLKYDPLQVGLTFLPANVLIAVLSIWASPALVSCVGRPIPITAGLLLSAAGLALLVRAPLDAALLVDVMPAMVLFGIGNGIAYSPLMLSALEGVASGDIGVASGVLNSSFAIGGAVGLSLIASGASVRTTQLLMQGIDAPSAINAGYHVAFAISAILSVIAAGLFALPRMSSSWERPPRLDRSRV